MNTVLVTGGMGHLGLYCAREIARRGDRAILFDIACTASNAEQDGVGWGDVRLEPGNRYWFPREAQYILGDTAGQVVAVRGNILDLSEMLDVIQRYGVTRIINAAALFNPVLSFQNPMEAFRTNCAGAVSVFEAARIAKLGRVVHLSTVAVNSELRYEPVDERHPTFDISAGNPSGPHGAVKVASEVLGMTYHSAYGVDFISLRMSAVYGFGMRLALHVRPMVELSVQGKECVFPKGDMRRDYIYIDDAAQGILCGLYADQPLAQRVFNIGSAVITSSGELADVVRDAIPGARIEIKGGMSALETSNSKMRGRLSIDAARQQLGFAPEFDLKRGIRAYAADLRKFNQGQAS
jgi:UDP-glucose 4-epimerase